MPPVLIVKVKKSSFSIFVFLLSHFAGPVAGWDYRARLCCVPCAAGYVQRNAVLTNHSPNNAVFDFATGTNQTSDIQSVEWGGQRGTGSWVRARIPTGPNRWRTGGWCKWRYLCDELHTNREYLVRSELVWTNGVSYLFVTNRFGSSWRETCFVNGKIQQCCGLGVTWTNGSVSVAYSESANSLYYVVTTFSQPFISAGWYWPGGFPVKVVHSDSVYDYQSGSNVVYTIHVEVDVR